MVKQIIWSKNAENDLITILEYFNNRNHSYSYSQKLNRLFQDGIKMIQDYPAIGRKTNFNNIKNIIVKNYLIFYDESDLLIKILAIWDTRQNPSKLKYKLV